MRVSIIFSIESSHIPIFYFSFARIYSTLDSSLRRIALAKLLVQTLDRVRGWLSLLREPVVMVEITSPPPFSLLVFLYLSLSLSISLSSRASASITRSSNVRVPASYGVTLQGLRAATQYPEYSTDNPSFLRFNLFRASSPVILYTYVYIRVYMYI